MSVPSNIAEGQGRMSTGEFRQFLGHARGSLFEVETQLEMARRLGYLQEDRAATLLATTGEVGRILNGLINSLN
jgi:four helix bundle protein